MNITTESGTKKIVSSCKYRTSMMLAMAAFSFGLCVLVTSNAHAESARMRQFRSDYGLLSIDLLNNPAEIATVKDFVYKKDVATFTFREGKLIFLRYLNKRPTTALFVGKGSVHIDIPYRLERENLKQISGDTLIDQEITVCAIHCADDFDLAAKEKMTFTDGKLDWDDYNHIMKAQAESYFSPSIFVQRDNFAQLVWSAMDRKADGFFWIDFGRSAFCYDPNRPEQNEIMVEREAADVYLTIGAQFPRQQDAPKSDAELSKISYPLSVTDQSGKIELSGVDGTNLKLADVTLSLKINKAQPPFIPFYLGRHLSVDSIWVNGTLCEYWKRMDHPLIYAYPEVPVKQGDSVVIRIQYHGDNYARIFPWVDDPAAVYSPIEFTALKGFTYFAPGMSKVVADGARQHFSSQFDPKVRTMSIAAIATGYDTTTVMTKSGFPISFIKVRAYSRGGLTDTKYQEMVVQTYEALAELLGNPPATFGLTVLPYGDKQLPGVASIPQQSTDLDGTGGFVLTAALALAQQWYGITAQPAGPREEWILDGVSQSVAQLAVMQVKGSPAMFSEVNGLARQVVLGIERQDDRPVAGHLDWRIPKEQNTGQTASNVQMSNEFFRMAKAGALFNQIRFELYDLAGQNGDATYTKLLRELTARLTISSFTNADFSALLQKYTGRDMNPFMSSFVFGGEMPRLDGTYQIGAGESGSSVSWNVDVTNVPTDFSAPVVIRVSTGKESKLFRQMLVAGHNQFKTDGLTAAATDVTFNEFFSLLSKDNIKK